MVYTIITTLVAITAFTLSIIRGQSPVEPQRIKRTERIRPLFYFGGNNIPKLNNPKHEQTAQLLVKNKFNKTQTYLEQYPDASYETANKNAPALMVNYGIVDRAIEILESAPETQLQTILSSFKDDLTAKKALVLNGRLKYVRDNNVVLDTKKYLVSKIYGAEQNNNVHLTDARQVTYNINNQSLEKIDRLIDKLSNLSNQHSRVDGKVINNGTDE